MDTPEYTTKQCKECLDYFPATTEHFTRDSSRKDGLNRLCKRCNHLKSMQWRKENPERAREIARNHYQHNRGKISARNAEWRKANWKEYYRKTKAGTIARARKWVQLNPEKRLETSRKSRANQNIKAKYRIYKQRYRARKTNLPDTLTQVEWQQALNYFNHCCAVCLRPLTGSRHTVSADHWIPLNNPDCPGTTVDNIIPLCHGLRGCNNKKHDLLPEVWLISEYGQEKSSEILKRIADYFEHIKHR